MDLSVGQKNKLTTYKKKYMETKKTKLINALNKVISALKNDTIHYEWSQQESCNCGVVAQAILCMNKVELKSHLLGAMLTMEKTKNSTEKKIDPTWQNAVKRLCPITGEPMVEIFKRLFENGLSKEDVVHLEYMNNQSILKRSGINTKKNNPEIITKKVNKETTELVPHWFPLFRWVGIKYEKKVVKEVEVQEKVNRRYHTQQSNLILYLTAWVAILKEGGKYKADSSLENVTIDELENELLNAVADEKYEYATELRNELALR